MQRNLTADPRPLRHLPRPAASRPAHALLHRPPGAACGSSTVPTPCSQACRTAPDRPGAPVASLPGPGGPQPVALASRNPDSQTVTLAWSPRSHGQAAPARPGSSCAPGRVLPRHPDDQRLDRSTGGRSSWPAPVRVSPLAGARSLCQRKIVADVTGKVSGHRRRLTSRDNGASQSPSAWSHRRRPLS